MKTFRRKILVVFIFLLKNIDCGYSLEPPRRGGSNEYPQSMFLSRNKINVYPCKPQIYCIKMGFKRIKIIWACFRYEYVEYLAVYICIPEKNELT